MICDGKRQIYLNSRQSKSQWLEAAFHELAHHLLHAPDNSPVALFYHLHSNKKEEFEAKAFMALALVPKFLVETKTVGDLQEEFGYSRELLSFRKELYELYKE
jgi:Zn-dependent peptidase ImmA (M78 family)